MLSIDVFLMKMHVTLDTLLVKSIDKINYLSIASEYRQANMHVHKFSIEILIKLYPVISSSPRDT